MSTRLPSIPYSADRSIRIPSAEYQHMKARWIMLDPADFQRRTNVANNTTSSFVACTDCHGYNYPEYMEPWDRINWNWLCSDCTRKRYERDGVPPHTCTGCEFCTDPRLDYGRHCVHDCPAVQPAECPGS